MRSALLEWLEAAGLILVVVGLGLVSLPLSLITAGVFLVVVANTPRGEATAVRRVGTAGTPRR